MSAYDDLLSEFSSPDAPIDPPGTPNSCQDLALLEEVEKINQEAEEIKTEITFRRRIKRVTNHRWANPSLLRFKVQWKGYDLEEYLDLEDLPNYKGQRKVKHYLKRISKRGMTTILARKPWVVEQWLRS